MAPSNSSGTPQKPQKEDFAYACLPDGGYLDIQSDQLISETEFFGNIKLQEYIKKLIPT